VRQLEQVLQALERLAISAVNRQPALLQAAVRSTRPAPLEDTVATAVTNDQLPERQTTTAGSPRRRRFLAPLLPSLPTAVSRAAATAVSSLAKDRPLERRTTTVTTRQRKYSAAAAQRSHPMAGTRTRVISSTRIVLLVAQLEDLATMRGLHQVHRPMHSLDTRPELLGRADPPQLLTLEESVRPLRRRAHFTSKLVPNRPFRGVGATRRPTRSSTAPTRRQLRPQCDLRRIRTT